MSLIFFLLFLLTNFYTSAICDTKCKEYLIIIKETSCPTNSSLIREPIKLHDLKFNHDNCSEDSSKTLSNYENSNKSYVIKFDYIGFESVCIPIIKSNKLLDHIKIDDENITTNENKDRHDINKTMVTENNDTKTYPLECIIKNYKETCNKKEAKQTMKNEIRKRVNINLIHANELISNITETIYNYTEASIIFEKCVLNDYFCTNSNTIDDYFENNDTISQIILTSIENKDTSVFSVMNKDIKNLNCTNIINKHKNIKIDRIKALTNSILTKYYCQDEDIDDRNFTVPKYDVSVYLNIDLNILNTNLEYLNCTANLKSKNSTGLNVDCKVNQSVEMYINKDNYTTTSVNNSLPDIDLFEDFNQSLVYHCKLKKVNTTTDSYSKTTEIFNEIKIFDYQTCIEQFNADIKKAHLDGSKILIISDEVHKDNFTNLEDFGSYTNSEILKLHFINSNISDCSEKIPLNITKGRIISLLPDEEKKERVYNDSDSTLFKLVITNCDNYNTKSLANENKLELDIILINTNYTQFHRNEIKVNKLKKTLGNNTNRAILNCAYFNENIQLYNNNSVMECIFLESNNNIMTTTVETPTSENPVENKHIHLSNRLNDSFNVHNKGINTTTKTPKVNHFGKDEESKDEGKIRNEKKNLNIISTTETNPWREKAAVQRNQTDDNDPFQEMYYVSPRVLTTAIVALLAVVGSVLTYALCIFKKKEQAYQATPTRDWSEMDATEF